MPIMAPVDKSGSAKSLSGAKIMNVLLVFWMQHVFHKILRLKYEKKYFVLNFFIHMYIVVKYLLLNGLDSDRVPHIHI